MKTTVLLFLTGILTATEPFAQGNNANVPNGKSNAASVGVNIPVGKFSQTHFAGISLGYLWSHHRFGLLKKRPKRLIGFTGNGGIGYYFGRNEVIAGSGYRYGGYISLHAFGGALLNPGRKGYIALSTGVTAGIYKGTANAGIGASLDGGYPLTEVISLAGSIIYLNQKNAAGLCAANIRVEYSF